MSKEQDLAATRARLLEAAGEVFAERGFRSATIRDICQRANANGAAIHYHFGDKQSIYTEVLRHWAVVARQKFPPTLDLGKNPTAEQRLHAFIRSLLYRLTDKGRPTWHGKVMAREMVEPTEALDKLMDDVVRPYHELLLGIVTDIIGRAADARLLRRCAYSILGQCVFYCNARPVVERLSPDLKFDPDDIDQLANHITQFSLHALRGLNPEGENRAP